MTEQYRRMIVRFNNQEDMDRLGLKVFEGTDYKLTTNVKTVSMHQNGFDIEFKRKVKTRAREKKEWEYHWDIFPFSNQVKTYFGTTEFQLCSNFTNEKIGELFEQNVTNKTTSIFFPKKEKSDENRIRVVGNRPEVLYPVYIVSKGRAQTCITADHLVKMEVPFRIIVEPQEVQKYSEVYGAESVVELDMSFIDKYDEYLLDHTKTSKGPGPARNFAWWHSKEVLKAKWHWVMDDNILGFNYFMDNQRLKAVDGTVFRGAEDFVNRYDNIAISGLNYYMFAVPGAKDRPYVSNTKIYSCLLINNDATVRWAGRYNEDVDICIHSMKEGYSTIQFDAFLAKKMGTQLLAGGNTDAFYSSEGTLPKSNMLAYTHPDITHVQWRYQRWHHMTNYNLFKHFRERSILDTIKYLMKPQILDPTEHPEIIDEIMNLPAFGEYVDWDIFKSIAPPLRTDCIKLVKEYWYTQDKQKIIEKLTEKPLLDCDTFGYEWNNELDDTTDNNLMLKLLSLGNDKGILDTVQDWDEILKEQDDYTKKRIIFEMKRCKSLFKRDIEHFDYKFDKYVITEQEHYQYYDSNPYILHNYHMPDALKDTEFEDIITLFDKRIRNEVKIEQKKFKCNLTKRNNSAEKNENDKVVLIHGDESFNDELLFKEKIKELLPDDFDEIINSVLYPVDLMSAYYSLHNKIKSKDFVPDETLYGNAKMYKLYDIFIEYADEAIIFINIMTPEMEYLINLFEKANKRIQIIKSGTQTEELQGW